MAKFVPDARLDLMLDQTEGTKIHVCSAQPTTYAEAETTYSLAETTISGSYTAANGDTSGRKNTCPAQSGVSIASSGTATHVAVTNGTDTLYAVTTCTSQALTSGGTVDIPAWDQEVGDPT